MTIKAKNHPQNPAAYGFGVHLKWILEAMTVKKIKPWKKRQPISPRWFFLNTLNGGNVDFANLSKFSIGKGGILNKPYLLISQFSMGMASLGARIGHIIKLRTYKEVVWVYAISIIARMAHKHRFGGQLSNMNFIGNSVSHSKLSVVPKQAVSILVFTANPLPASRFSNLKLILEPHLFELANLLELFKRSVANGYRIMIAAKLPSNGFFIAKRAFGEKSAISHAALPIVRYAAYYVGGK